VNQVNSVCCRKRASGHKRGVKTNECDNNGGPNGAAMTIIQKNTSRQPVVHLMQYFWQRMNLVFFIASESQDSKGKKGLALLSNMWLALSWCEGS
jgi:hypothetical protein